MKRRQIQIMRRTARESRKVKTMKKNIRDIAKASTCAALAGTTALSGAAAQAFASPQQQQSEDINYGIIEYKEVTALPTIDAAQEALELANKETTSATSNYNAAKKTYEVAQNATQKAKGAKDAAEREISSAREALENEVLLAKEIIDAADSDLANAQNDYDIALEEKRQAEANRDAANAKLAEAKSAYEKAMKDAQDAGEADASAVSSAREDMEKAQEEAKSAANKIDTTNAALDAATSAREAAEKKVAAASAARDSKQEDVNAAASELSSLKAELARIDEDGDVAAAQAKVTAAENALTTKKNELSALETELSNAKAGYDSAKSAENDARTAYNNAESALSAIDVTPSKEVADREAAELVKANDAATKATANKLNAQRVLKQAQEDLASAQKAYDDANAVVEETQKRLNEAGAALLALGDANCSLKDYFTDAGESGEYGLDELTNRFGTDVAEATQIGRKGDATSYDNVLKALDTIRNLNAIRASLGLNELKVTNALMGRSTVSANWSATHKAHSTGSGAENLAWGWNNPLDGWYDFEKAIWDAALATNVADWDEPGSDVHHTVILPDGWQNMTANELKTNYYEFYHGIGHYLNVINPNYHFVGAAYNDADDTFDGFINAQNYSAYNGDVDDPGRTVDEWENDFKLWYADKIADDTERTAANAAYDTALANKISAVEEANRLKSACDAKESNVAANEANVVELERAEKVAINKASAQAIKADEALSAYENVQASYTKAEEAKNSAKAKLETASREFEAIEAIINGDHESRIEQLNRDITTSSAGIETLRAEAQAVVDGRASIESLIEQTETNLDAYKAELTPLIKAHAVSVGEKEHYEKQEKELEDMLLSDETNYETVSAKAVAAKNRYEELVKNNETSDSERSVIVSAAYDKFVAADNALSFAQMDVTNKEFVVSAKDSDVAIARDEANRVHGIMDTINSILADDDALSNLDLEALDWLARVVADYAIALDSHRDAVDALADANRVENEAKSAMDFSFELLTAAVSAQASAQMTYDQVFDSIQNTDNNDTDGANSDDNKPNSASNANDEGDSNVADIPTDASSDGITGEAGTPNNSANASNGVTAANQPNEDFSYRVADAISGYYGIPAVASYTPLIPPAYSLVLDENAEIIEPNSAVVEEEINDDMIPMATFADDDDNSFASGLGAAGAAAAGAALVGGAAYEVRRRRKQTSSAVEFDVIDNTMLQETYTVDRE